MLLCQGLEIILAGVAFKSLFFNAYHSTDFEVHRNWLAVTYSTNLSEWYTEATSKWTLDYPPFFAYFEWILAHIGRHVDPLMVVLSVEPYASPATIYFQRITVVVSEFLLLYSICTLVSGMLEPLGPKARNQYLVAISLFIFNFGLFIVDHVHFQYNGFLFGVLFLSVLKIFQGSFLWGGFWFAVLLNLKHTFLYLAPVYFLIILLHYCLPKDTQTPGLLFRRLLVMSVIVCGVFTASLGPFVYWGKLPDLLARLFPFQRGLCHSYWAPNFWALYNAIDKAISSSGTLNAYCALRTDIALENRVDMTSGLTGNYVHSCLPTVRPVHAAILTAVFILPSLVICRRSKGELQAADSGFTLVRAIVAAAWASFLFGWHVHEKAVLTVTLPLTFLAVASRRLRSLAFYVTTVAHFSLLPLIYTRNEQPAVLSTYLLYTLSHYLLLGRSSTPVSSGRLHSLWPIISVLAQVHLIGLFPLLLVNRLILPYLFPRLEFLPLMLVSVYCAVGLLMAFFVYVWINLSWLMEERLADKEAEAENEYYQVKAAFFKKND